MALFPTCHKTVFVLDHGPYFALPCQQVEYDVGRRTGPGFIPLNPITKTVWTSAVEAVSEYCRCVIGHTFAILSSDWSDIVHTLF